MQSGVSGAQGPQNKGPETGRPTQQKEGTVSLWRPEVQGHGASGAALGVHMATFSSVSSRRSESPGISSSCCKGTSAVGSGPHPYDPI